MDAFEARIAVEVILFPHGNAGPVAVAIRIMIIGRPIEEQVPRDIDNRECDALGVSGNR
jgi:hypothetical protein